MSIVKKNFEYILFQTTCVSQFLCLNDITSLRRVCRKSRYVKMILYKDWNFISKQYIIYKRNLMNDATITKIVNSKQNDKIVLYNDIFPFIKTDCSGYVDINHNLRSETISRYFKNTTEGHFIGISINVNNKHNFTLHKRGYIMKFNSNQELNFIIQKAFENFKRYIHIDDDIDLFIIFKTILKRYKKNHNFDMVKLY